MEHILQFGINIDDDRIKKSVYESAEKKIIEDIQHDVKCQLFETSYYTGKPTNEPSPFVKKQIDMCIQSCKDEIIELAATKLAERLFKTKKWKETMAEVINDN